MKVLIVEDTPNDVELIKRVLEKSHRNLVAHAAEDRASLEQALREQSWDVVLSDFDLIDINGFEVLKIKKALAPQTPLIVVSGAVGEETAADLFLAGAKDFISKSNLSRLVPAVEREILESERLRKLHELETKLHETERNLRIVVDSVRDHAIYMIDADRRIISWNGGAERITGYSESEALGQKIDLFYIDEDRTAGIPEREFQDAIAGKTTSIERWKVRKDGSRFWASGSITVLANQDGTLRGFAQILRDETERKRSQQLLEQARLKAEEANIAKTQFLANMSHEIRTPLGVILGFAEMIESGTESETNLGFARRIIKNGTQLSRIIDDVLDVSKVEASCLDIERTNISLRETLEDALSLLRFKADQKGVGLSLNVSNDLDDLIFTDPTRLRQVVLNVIGNAIKFTSSGKVCVDVSESSESPGLMSILVTDTGKGIPKEAVTKLFQPFSQGDVSVNRQFGGTGLGLYLSKKLCQALGGDLRLVRTSEREGSTFEISFVSHDPSRPNKAPTTLRHSSSTTKPLAVSGNDLTGVRILVIDDSQDNRAIFQCFLSLAGAYVECAENGIEGLSKLSTGSFDIILLDIQMPMMDGYEVISRIREQGFRKPVVALTAHALLSERQKCLNHGFDEHVAKPVSRQTLIDSITSICSRDPKQSPRIPTVALKHM